MISIFACPKKFDNQFANIQRNAIRSWKSISPDVEIILLGDDPGTREVSAEFGLKHIPDIETNNQGTPLLSSLFRIGVAQSSFDIKMFINADIILMPSFIDSIRSVSSMKSDLLMIGKRTNLDVLDPIDFSSTTWPSLLEEKSNYGEVQPSWAIDYFVFTGNPWPNMPDFAIGRPGYDNWLIYEAWKKGLIIIDATEDVICIHQNHDYSHAGSGSREEVYDGSEAKVNRELIVSQENIFTIDDATHYLKNGKIKPARLKRHLWRRCHRLGDYHPIIARLLGNGYFRSAFCYIFYRF